MVHRSHNCCQSAPRIDRSGVPGRLQRVHGVHSRRLLLFIRHLRIGNETKAPDYPYAGYALGAVQTRPHRGANNYCCDWLQCRWHLLLILASHGHRDCCHVELVFCGVLVHDHGSLVVVVLLEVNQDCVGGGLLGGRKS